MNRAYLDMLQCLNTATSVKGMEMSVLEQQKMALKRQQEQLLKVQQQHELSCYSDLSMLSFLPTQAQEFQMLDVEPFAACPTMNGIMGQQIKADPSTENRWMDFGMQQSGVTGEHSGAESAGQINSPSHGMNCAISRTTSLTPIMMVDATGMKMIHDSVEGGENLSSEQGLDGETGRVCAKKRKAEKNPMISKIREAEEGNRSKRSKGFPDEEESKITEQNSNRNSSQSKQKEISGNISDRKNKEDSRCTSKDNSTASPVQKTDYIHVRARRGQATDSHSLAERVRREKISERMRYLQDLVPGCNKITGKAGMLDEIINYVQSLQRQVEFLSMKLAAVSPNLDFNIDDLIVKEVLAACSSSLPILGVSPDLANPNYLQYNLIQQMDSVCPSEVVASSIDTGLQRNISEPGSMPETFLDTPCFNHTTNSLQWDADLQNIYNTEFQQGRATSFPFQTFTGIIDASRLKTEM